MKWIVKDRCFLIDFLLEQLGTTSKTKIRKLMKHREILLDGQSVAHPHVSLQTGQTIEIGNPKSSGRFKPPFTVVYEDRYLLAAEKPPRIVSMGRDKEMTFLYQVNQYLLRRSRKPERAFLVHRLDRDVSGILLFAKSPEIKRRLQQNWSETDKRYYALVEGGPPKPQGVIRSWLKEDQRGKVFSCPEGPDSKYAVTHFLEIQSSTRYTLLEIRTETGRKNQIRAHLAELGCPIAGDRKYGAVRDPLRRLGLHAYSLSFPHPVTGETVRLRISLPKSFSLFDQQQKSDVDI